MQEIVSMINTYVWSSALIYLCLGALLRLFVGEMQSLVVDC